ncbi:CheR family methyltransferase [Stakelama marina]|uniref:Chemotaxis protein methyltransferase n=1 Tax=Stakelama marina TaxID=2826939 RepID=A0A8T4I9C3_9SPHN|nr:protein-glutamate O-methyltransferase CheR [Stakelama marina]MBR0550961.1 protein-glutamate O-methyltransferase CheR [Stakelama marina]
MSTAFATAAAVGADASGAEELAPAEFARIAAIMQSEARIALSPAKTTLVCSRLSRRLRTHGLTTFRDYLSLVDRDAEERAAMVVALTTNHTHFFRENHHFEHFREHVVPELRQRAEAGHPIRIWSAGCSSGEEVYTIVMCLLGPSRSGARWVFDRDVKLLATDIAPHVVAATRRGVYSEMTVEPIPEAYRREWLQAQGNEFAIDPQARQLVTARELNLFGQWPMRQQYDVIFCRNVMIYFDDPAKAELEQRFAQMLRPGGHLYIGHSERLIGPAADMLSSCGQTIYRRDAGQ